MVKIEKSLSLKFRNALLVAAFFVVYIHVPTAELTPGNGLWIVHELVYNGIALWAVPLFFVASGYFLGFAVKESGWYPKAVSRRMRTIAIPYFATLLFFAACKLFCGIPVVGEGSSLGKSALNLIGANPFIYPVADHMWYLRALMGLVIISPLLVYAIRKIGIYFLLITALLYLVFAPTWGYRPWGDAVYGLFRRGVSLEGVHFFALGLYLKINDVRINNLSTRTDMFLLPLAIGGVLARFLFDLNKCTLPMGYYFTWLSIPALLIVVWMLVPSNDWGGVASLSFPIYLIHPFIVLGAGRVGMVATSAVGYLAYGFVLFTISAMIAIAIRKFTPRFASLWFGGR